MDRAARLGLTVPELLLPAPGVDLARWAVVACDQYTSEPEYWAEVERQVGEAPSTLRLIYPEVFLAEEPGPRIARIHAAMRDYLASGVLVPRQGLVSVTRTVGGRARHGLVVALDLEAYDWHAGSTALVRATEGTIESRLPPRVRIREGAPIELPHIMVLIDDPEDRVLSAARAAASETLYDFELMQGGGRLSGRWVDPDALDPILDGLEALTEPRRAADRYGVGLDAPPMLYAMGDGNHSLATAKAIWEAAKAAHPERAADDPRRHALVELVNLHDPALEFEPIHRVLFRLRDGLDVAAAIAAHHGGRVEWTRIDGLTALADAVEAAPEPGTQRFGLITAEGHRLGVLRAPELGLPVASVQAALDALMAAGGAEEIDYVHGSNTVDALGRKPGCAGLFLPAMDKHALFRSVIHDGALPRKTFSMGEAWEKRFYLEARRIAAPGGEDAG
jgi:hypothetical protein